MAYTTIDDPEQFFKSVLYTGNGGTQDITLPTIIGNPNIQCPNVECESIKEVKNSSVTYIKYDAENMKYIYICNYCGQKWKNS